MDNVNTATERQLGVEVDKVQTLNGITYPPSYEIETKRVSLAERG